MTVNVGKIRQQLSVTSFCIFDCHFANPATGTSLNSLPISSLNDLIPLPSYQCNKNMLTNKN